MRLIATSKGDNGYIEKLYSINKHYYRIVRTAHGDWYSLYVNDSQYGEPEFDVTLYINNRRVRECTISECITTIKSLEENK